MRVVGRIVLILALAVGVVPWFADCESQGKAIILPNGKAISMRCHWTGRAEGAVAISLAAVGVLMLVAQRRESLGRLLESHSQRRRLQLGGHNQRGHVAASDGDRLRRQLAAGQCSDGEMKRLHAIGPGLCCDQLANGFTEAMTQSR